MAPPTQNPSALALQPPTPDSRPIPLASLTEDQVAVVRGVNALLAGMVRAPDAVARPQDRRKGCDPCDPCGRASGAPWARVDADRTGRVLLIDGDRGLGKTSVLLTLIQGWQERDTAPQWADFGFDDVAEQILALDILDFDPLPPHMPLYGWLVMGFLRVVRHLDAQRRGDDRDRDRRRAEARAPWEDEGASDDVQTLWERAYRAAVAGWSAGKDDKGESLDDLVYEAREGTSHWSRLQGHFTDLVDAIHKGLEALGPRREGPGPLLVLPIDDVDLQPGRVKELLTALRVLRHPRLAVVLTGDSEHLREVLTGDLAAARSDKARSDFDGRIARAILDKVIPKAHRLKIGRLPLAGALALADTKLSTRLKSGAPPDDPTSTFQIVHRYAELFPEPLFRHRDVLQAAHDSALDAKRGLEYLAQLLVEPESEELGRAPDVQRDGSDLRALGDGERSFFSGNGGLVVIRERASFAQLLPAGVTPPVDLPASERLASLLRLDADHRGRGRRWSDGRWLGGGLCAIGLPGAPGGALLPWPRLAFEAPWQAVWRAERWKEITSNLGAYKPAAPIDALAWCWLREQLDLHLEASQVSPLPESFGDSAWEELLDALREAARPPEADRTPFYAWYAFELPLFVAPEYGLSADVQRRIASRTTLRLAPGDWPERRTEAIRAALGAHEVDVPAAVGGWVRRPPASATSPHAIVASLEERHAGSVWNEQLRPSTWYLRRVGTRTIVEAWASTQYRLADAPNVDVRFVDLAFAPSWSSARVPFEALLPIDDFLLRDPDPEKTLAPLIETETLFPTTSVSRRVLAMWTALVEVGLHAKLISAAAFRTAQKHSSIQHWFRDADDGRSLTYAGPPGSVEPVVDLARSLDIDGAVVRGAQGWSSDLGAPNTWGVQADARPALTAWALVMQSFMADRGTPAKNLEPKCDAWVVLAAGRHKFAPPPVSAWVDVERFRLAWGAALAEADKRRTGGVTGLKAWLALNLTAAGLFAADRRSRGQVFAVLPFPVQPGNVRELLYRATPQLGGGPADAVMAWAGKVVDSGLIGAFARDEWHAHPRVHVDVQPTVAPEGAKGRARKSPKGQGAGTAGAASATGTPTPPEAPATTPPGRPTSKPQSKLPKAATTTQSPPVTGSTAPGQPDESAPAHDPPKAEGTGSQKPAKDVPA